MSASRAGSAAASQSCTTRDRNALPAGALSVTSRPPVSPYQPIAEALMNVFGRGWVAVSSVLANAVARAAVARTRLARISAL
ncbi:MAG: hypothetical protein QOH87_4201 [Trebonia sp.]|nr:hypothetical protein [Trebonia sp.]